MNLRFDYNNMMTDAVGDKGICPCVFDKNAEAIKKAHKSVMDNRGKGWQEWCDLPFVKDDYLDEMISYCGEIGKKAESFVLYRRKRARPLSRRLVAASPASQRAVRG